MCGGSARCLSGRAQPFFSYLGVLVLGGVGVETERAGTPHHRQLFGHLSCCIVEHVKHFPGCSLRSSQIRKGGLSRLAWLVGIFFGYTSYESVRRTTYSVGRLSLEYSVGRKICSNFSIFCFCVARSFYVIHTRKPESFVPETREWLLKRLRQIERGRCLELALAFVASHSSRDPLSTPCLFASPAEDRGKAKKSTDMAAPQ